MIKNNTDKEDALKASIRRKRASLTEQEIKFLTDLLQDSTTDVSDHERQVEYATKLLDEGMLLQLPFGDNVKSEHQMKTVELKRPQHYHVGLWSAFEEGIKPKVLTMLGLEKRREQKVQRKLSRLQSPPIGIAESNVENDCTIRSDEEVRDYKDILSENSSWSEDDLPEHYDAWEVLRDEYGKDFGYNYIPSLEDDLDDIDDHRFLILGTSANDKAAHPHVLSPPMMDSLMTYFPEVIKNQNFWLKYSLVRDGASLETLIKYARASPKTLMAIETSCGNVFGSFTSDTWRYERRFYANSRESFLWRMRHSRNTKSHCLFEQAHKESEIEVFPYTGKNDMLQYCNRQSQRLAIGGGYLESNERKEGNLAEQADRFGFGLTIDGLSHGCSSPCATYGNPCLVDGSQKSMCFKIVNLEIWTLTPCMTVDSAKKLEMRHYRMNQDSLSQSIAPSGINDFYRRVGENDHQSNLKRDNDLFGKFDVFAKFGEA